MIEGKLQLNFYDTIKVGHIANSSDLISNVLNGKYYISIIRIIQSFERNIKCKELITLNISVLRVITKIYLLINLSPIWN